MICTVRVEFMVFNVRPLKPVEFEIVSVEDAPGIWSDKKLAKNGACIFIIEGINRKEIDEMKDSGALEFVV